MPATESPPPDPIADAVAVLNRKRHRYGSGQSVDEWYFDGSYVRGPDYYDAFSPFEAIAIAARYLHEEKADDAR